MEEQSAILEAPIRKGGKFFPAHHGTTRNAWLLIQREGFRLNQRNRETPNYMGDGIYFFENSPLDALEWGRRSRGETVVIEAEIDAEGCLDWCDKAVREFLGRYYEHFCGRMHEKNLPCSEAIFCNWLSKKIDAVSGFRAPQQQRDAPINRSKFVSARMIICVCKVDKILSSKEYKF